MDASNRRQEAGIEECCLNMGQERFPGIPLFVVTLIKEKYISYIMPEMNKILKMGPKRPLTIKPGHISVI